MLLLCLKIVSLSLQLAVTAQVLEHLRLPFEFRRWRYAWRAMLVASLLMTSKRIYDFWDVVPFATIGMNMTTDLAFLYALWNLRVIFMRELGAPLLDPVAHVTIDQHSQIVAWDATATRPLWLGCHGRDWPHAYANDHVFTGLGSASRWHGSVPRVRG